VVVIKVSVVLGNVRRTAELGGEGEGAAGGRKATYSGPRLPLVPKPSVAKTVCTPFESNFKISPVVAVPGMPISAQKRLSVLSKANPRGFLVRPVTNGGRFSVPSESKLRMSPVPSLGL